MSLLGSMTTAISGLTAQARNLGHISDNVANSQTLGYKRVDTSFVSWLTRSSDRAHAPGSVEARPDYTNTIQGTVEQTDNPLAMAIAGQGFFSVAQARGTANGEVMFDERAFYTRAGDFQLDRDGYLVNSANYYLQGWQVNASGVVDRTSVRPIRITDQIFNPVATTRIDLAANLPAALALPSLSSALGAAVDNATTPDVDEAGPAVPANTSIGFAQRAVLPEELADREVSSTIQIYDALGAAHQLQLDWRRTAANTWQVRIREPGQPISTTSPIAELVFADGSNPALPAGTLQSITDVNDTTEPTSTAPGDPATLGVTLALAGLPASNLTLSFGRFGRAEGLTQYAGNSYNVRNFGQDGVPGGSFSGVSLRETGDIVVNYDNGQSRVIARIPVAAFNEPDKLQRLDGQAFMRTLESGEARLADANSNGVGKLVTGSIERSNVDIAAEFSKLILAQRAYTANTRIVTASDEMLQDTINMRR